MRAVLGLLLLFGGAEVLYLVATGKLGGSTSSSSAPTSTTGGNGTMQLSSMPASQGTQSGGNIPTTTGGIIPV